MLKLNRTVTFLQNNRNATQAVYYKRIPMPASIVKFKYVCRHGRGIGIVKSKINKNSILYYSYITVLHSFQI